MPPPGAGNLGIGCHAAPQLQILLFPCHWDRLRVAGPSADYRLDPEALGLG